VPILNLTPRAARSSVYGSAIGRSVMLFLATIMLIYAVASFSMSAEHSRHRLAMAWLRSKRH
jgi:hypothetical protein